MLAAEPVCCIEVFKFPDVVFKSVLSCPVAEVNSAGTYEWNGIRGKSYTYNNYRIGDQIPINVSISAK